MKRFGLVLLVAAGCCRAWGQVTVEVTLEQDQFLVGEAIKAAVRVTNLSGQPVHLGKEEDWLTFGIESPEGFVVAKSGDAPVAGEFDLESSQVGIKRVDLAPWFDLTRLGRYSIIATVKIPQWGTQQVSPPKGFNLISGTALWEQTFGVPIRPGATNTMPEVRKYALQQANWLKGQPRLYLRLTDADGGRVFRVLPIGGMVSFSKPEHLVDKLSNLHVLYANGPRTYSYTEVTAEGEVIERQIFEYVGSRPRLHINEDGTISVQGGLRRDSARDLPGRASRTNEAGKAISE